MIIELKEKVKIKVGRIWETRLSDGKPHIQIMDIDESEEKFSVAPHSRFSSYEAAWDCSKQYLENILIELVDYQILFYKEYPLDSIVTIKPAHRNDFIDICFIQVDSNYPIFKAISVMIEDGLPESNRYNDPIAIVLPDYITGSQIQKLVGDAKIINIQTREEYLKNL